MEALNETTKKVGKTKVTKDRGIGQVDTVFKRLDKMISDIRHDEYGYYNCGKYADGKVLKRYADRLTEIVKAI